MAADPGAVGEGGRAPLYGAAPDPVRLAQWAGAPSVAYEPPEPPAAPPRADCPRPA